MLLPVEAEDFLWGWAVTGTNNPVLLSDPREDAIKAAGEGDGAWSPGCSPSRDEDLQQFVAENIKTTLKKNKWRRKLRDLAAKKLFTSLNLVVCVRVLKKYIFYVFVVCFLSD